VAGTPALAVATCLARQFPQAEVVAVEEVEAHFAHSGYHGAKRLLAVSLRLGVESRRIEVVAKSVVGPTAPEVVAYRAISDAAAPAPQSYGAVPTSEGWHLLVERLAHPGLPERGDAALEGRVRLALQWLALPGSLPLPSWLPAEEAWHAGFEAASGSSDHLLARWWASQGALPAATERRLGELAAMACHLPTGVVHRDLTARNTGRRAVDSEVLAFDLEHLAYGPRAIDLGEPIWHSPSLAAVAARQLGIGADRVVAEAAIGLALGVLDGLGFAVSALEAGATDTSATVDSVRAARRDALALGLSRLFRVVSDLPQLARRLC
jgi:hypothetical protein